jgi:hypothetical protein
MADIFQLGSYGTGSSSIGQTPSTLSTGDLRRRYNFGDRVSELAIAQDPFFRLVSKVAKKSVDDPEFKFTERRPSFHKRYAYPIAYSPDGITYVADFSAGGADTEGDLLNTAGSVIYVKMAADYTSAGNLQNIYGQSNNEILVGASGTQPVFYLEDQLIKVNWSSTAGGLVETYAILRVDTVTAQNFSAQTNHTTVDAVVLKCVVVKAKASAISSVATDHPAGIGVADLSATANASVYGTAIAGDGSSAGLEDMRSYVVGSTHAQGSGYPSTWKDQPFSTSYGRTQIWKTAMAMDNTTRATVLKYEPNEWARIWREKLVEHKWDIEQSILFGSQGQIDSATWTTQGAVDYVSSYGNVFSLSHASKTQDDFLDDMSKFLDPRYNNANATLFFVDTATYNWLHKLSGYFTNNLEISPNFRAEMALTGKKKVFGVDISVISTPYGDMNVARNVHMDGAQIKILAVNMRYCAYRPLVGNGLNRDTAIYVGVQTLENSGVDRRVDLIQTEAGMEWQMPEAHAYWS